MPNKRVAFKKEPGVDNLGEEFEIAIMSLYGLKLSCSKDVSNFEMSANNSDFKPFDDVILKITNRQNVSTTYAIQLKHLENRITLDEKYFVPHIPKNKVKFPLEKYFADGKRCERVRSILLSNAVIKEDVTLEEFTFDGDIHLDNVDNLLNTANGKKSIYEISKKSGGKISFYSSQKNLHEVNNAIVEFLQEKFAIENADIDDVVKRYTRFLRDWKRSCYDDFILFKEDIEMKLAEILLFNSICAVSTLAPLENQPKNYEIFKNAINSFSITIVNNQEEVHQVLGQLYHVEINTEDILEEGKNLFIIPKTVKDLNTLCPVELSLILWRLKKSPLILNTDKLHSTMSIINSLCQNHKFIFLTEQQPSICREFAHLTIFGCLQDIADNNQELYQKVVENFRISLQGRKIITLQELIATDLHFAKIITTLELAKMLNGHFCVGNVETLPEPYISRHISTTIFHTSLLNQVHNDIFIISGNCSQLADIDQNISRFKLQDYLNTVKRDCRAEIEVRIERKMCSSRKGIVVFTCEECSREDFQFICDKNCLANVHCLKILDGKRLQWVRTRGSRKSLRTHQIMISEDTISTNELNRINLLFAPAGMGKTTLLRFLKNNYPIPISWVVKVEWKEHCMFLEETHKADEILNHFLPETQDVFVNEVIRILRKNKLLVFFFDGIGDLQPKHFENAIDCKKQIIDAGFSLWVFTRDYLRETLENALDVISMDLCGLCDQQCRNYILKRTKDPTRKLCQNFNRLKRNVHIVAPLHLFMLTSIASRDRKKAGVFSLTELYIMFLEAQYKHYFKKTGLNCTEINLVLQNGIYFRNEQYKIAAVKSVLDPELWSGFNLRMDPNFLTEIIQKQDVIGVILKIIEPETIIFSHRTYSEYFAAVWLVDNYNKPIPKLSSYFFLQEYQNIRYMFDLELAGNSQEHIIVLNQFIDDVRVTEGVDLAGRTLLHIACSYAPKYPILDITKNGDRFVINNSIAVQDARNDLKENTHIHIVEKLITLDPFKKDVLFGWNALEYAFKTRYLEAIEIVLKYHRPTLKLADLKNTEEVFTFFYYSIIFGYVNLLSLVLQSEHSHCFLNLRNHNGEGFLHLAVRFDHPAIVKVLVENGIDPNVTDATHYRQTPLHLAASIGNAKVVRILCGVVQHEQLDRHRSTPLHIAISKSHFKVAKLLLEEGADVHAVDNFGETPLHYACARGNIQIIKLLLARQAKIGVVNLLGASALDYAYRKNNADIIRLLERCTKCTRIKKPLHAMHHKFDTIDVYKNKPLHYTVLTEDFEELGKKLRADCCVNERDEFGRTPLYYAVINSYPDGVQMLVQHNASVTLRYSRNKTIMHDAAIGTNDPRLIDILLSKSEADLMTQDDFGFIPLHWAAIQGHDEVIRMFLGDCRLVDLNVGDEFGRTALWWAVEMGNMKSAALLVASGASDPLLPSPMDVAHLNQQLNAQSINDPVNLDEKIIHSYRLNSPLQWAAYNGYVNILRSCLDKTHKVVRRGESDINSIDQFGFTPLHLAVIRNRYEIVKLLLEKGADINGVDFQKNTAFHWACQLGNYELVGLLLEYKANTDLPNEFGLTALHKAAIRGFYKTVRLLTGKRCEQIQDKYGRTALVWACERGHVKTAQALHADREMLDFTRKRQDVLKVLNSYRTMHKRQNRPVIGRNHDGVGETIEVNNAAHC